MHQYFTVNYEKCRNNFLNIINPDCAIRTRVPIPSLIDATLGIDFIYIPSQKERIKLLVLCSGIHGIETYVGSALQQIFWKQFSETINSENTGYVFIHGINAYGFKYYRRFTENNVDLNRNFDITTDLFGLKNELYGTLNHFINPSRPLNNLLFENIDLYFNLFLSISIYSLSVLKQVLPQGQYEYPKGIFFGGKAFEPQVSIIEQFLKPLINDYKYSMILDLHTGAGERRKMHLIEAPSMVKQLNRKLIGSVFSGQKLENDETTIHKETGSFLDWIIKITDRKQNIIPVLIEFGTVGMSGISDAAKSLFLVLRENQIFHHGSKRDCDKNSVVSDYLSMFYPDNVSWQDSVVNQFVRTMKIVIDKYEQICK